MIRESYVHGASSQPLIGETIGRHFDHIAGRFPDRPALVVRHQNVRLSYAELKQRVDAVAAGFIALGLKPGDRIGIWSPNNLEWVLTQFATAKAGLILVNINPAYRSHELEYAVNKVGCSALILSPALKTSNYLDILREIAPELEHCAPGKLRSIKLPALRTVIRLGADKTPGMFNFADLERAATPEAMQELQALAALLQFDDPINIQFTSGTTGSPKGATLTHHNILNNGFFIGEAMRLTEIDRLCIPVPFYHCFGMVLGNLACLTHGACMVIPGEAFDPLAVLQTVEAEKCTGLHGVPTMFIAILGHPDFKTFDLSSLRTGIMAGSPCPIEVMRKVIHDMHQSEITIAYGMTETSPVSFQSSATDPLERRVSTVGRIHPHVEVKIIDADGAIVAPGVTGELLTRGYSVMRGYWGDDANTAATIDAARWMHTGDLATIDAEGYCNIVGRIKDLVIRGGENIYPREIEEFLYTHPGIADVQVFGIPDAKYGECLCAWIRVRADSTLSEHDVLQFCKGRIAHYKVPAHIRFVEAYPMTVTGKIQKFIMRQAMIDELGLMEAKTA
ncbi:AMP-binding protein [Phyllobacterium myrsinacearum]|uniref:3-methylmercaptopropionyl-CoA ligase n=1 Tax=Phyllobacterium myrsinacearum TaxID=28101 RepID=A0A2S9JF86_9HYPH|nr:AMP-binding protein [Phyllobacterium myrsinacearum]PRD51587.1 AMP-binding protein [Phyllobacterium myrsinacearum]PWV89554.1 fatty-acyl-CoA synthase [Phyllobacterium myrsinacearum]RZU99855.1 fatty-acyl-CoA synthase [Phyllobacterium myrsinacearum]